MELLGQSAAGLLGVGDCGHFFLSPVHAGAAFVQSAVLVAHGDVLEACTQQHLDNCNACRACAAGDDLDGLLLLADHLECIQQTCQNDNSRAVLIVVEYGNITLFLQLALDLEAAGGRNILQIDAAERAGDHIYGVDKLVNVLGLDTEGECVNVSKRLEQRAFALHNGHTCLGADVAQTENGAAVGDNGAQIVAAGQFVGFVYVLLDLQAGGCNTGGVCQRQILTGGAGNGGYHLYFSAFFIMQLQAFCADISCHRIYLFLVYVVTLILAHRKLPFKSRK